jgi:hypothetical protein
MAVGRPQPLSGRSIAYEFERQGLGFVAGQQIWHVSHASGRIGGQGAGDVIRAGVSQAVTMNRAR